MWGIFRFFKNLFQNNIKITEYQKQIILKNVDQHKSVMVDISLGKTNKKQPSQTEQVRLYLIKNNSITTYEATYFYNVHRLSSIICRLRRRGMQIKTSKLKVKLSNIDKTQSGNNVLYSYTPEPKSEVKK